jgi:hypothetical protein
LDHICNEETIRVFVSYLGRISKLCIFIHHDKWATIYLLPLKWVIFLQICHSVAKAGTPPWVLYAWYLFLMGNCMRCREIDALGEPLWDQARLSYQNWGIYPSVPAPASSATCTYKTALWKCWVPRCSELC